PAPSHCHAPERNSQALCRACPCALLTDERDRVQKKTFTKWVNKHLMKVRKHINDLYEDLRDGHNLISLLEVLSGVKLPREKGRMRFHRLQNVQIALDFLKQRQVRAGFWVL
uniref:Calponin-homology (CH) domain-containing protein n=1 Tax=Nothoprocta perdicaria TaxID=30464 RepID=A0A8C6ZI75_NOTPE